MLLQAAHEVRPHQAMGVTRPVVHLGGGHELPTHLQAGNHDGVEIGAGRIYGRRPAGRARAQNKKTMMLGVMELGKKGATARAI